MYNLLVSENIAFSDPEQVENVGSSSPCPVVVVENFLKVGSHVKNSRLFRRILHTEKKMELRKEPMSYSRARELIKRELQKEELDPKLYGVHSLRAGGASAALGVPDRLFQRQGEWRSERSQNNYIQESMESLLTVTNTIQARELISHLWLNFHLVQIYQTLSDIVLG